MAGLAPPKTQQQMLYSALVDAFPALSSGIFQFSAAPIEASWWEAGAATDQWMQASICSSTVTGIFAPKPGFYEAYYDLITSLKVPDATKNKDYQEVQTKITDNAAQYSSVLTKATQSYQIWKKQNVDGNGNTMTMTTWLSSVFGANFQAEINALNQEKQVLAKQLAVITKALDQAVYKAQKNLDIDKITIAPAGGSAETVHDFSIGGDLPGDKTRWDLMGENEWGFQDTITWDETVKHPWKVLYSQNVEQHCLTTSTKNALDVSRIIQDEHYSLTLRAKGIGLYSIQQGRWFDPAFVRPDVELEPNASVTNESLFGVDGPLHLIPSGYLVMYKAETVLTVTTTTYDQYIKGKAGASVNWLDLFGFHFDVSQSSGIVVESKDKVTTVTLPVPNTSVPQIIGLVSSNAFLAPTPKPKPKAQALDAVT